MSLRCLLTLIVSLFIVSFTLCEETNIRTMSSTDQKQWNVVGDPNRQLVLRLRANPSIGASWYLTKLSSSDLKVITPINLTADGASNEFKADQPVGSQPLEGAEGYYYFRFTPKSKGTVRLRFDYKGVSGTINTMYVTVTIK
jgi:hypothetical protein